jgi:hypothetical protein
MPKAPNTGATPLAFFVTEPSPQMDRPRPLVALRDLCDLYSDKQDRGAFLSPSNGAQPGVQAKW